MAMAAAAIARSQAARAGRLNMQKPLLPVFARFAPCRSGAQVVTEEIARREAGRRLRNDLDFGSNGPRRMQSLPGAGLTTIIVRGAEIDDRSTTSRTDQL